MELIIHYKSADKEDNHVAIYLDENTNRYCYVNLTKGHVCRCRFNNVKEALHDLIRYPDIDSIGVMNYPLVKMLTLDEFLKSFN